MPDKDDHLNHLIEWQKNQFNPGHYVGNGKTPPVIEAKGNLRLATRLNLIMGLCLFAQNDMLAIGFVN